MLATAHNPSTRNVIKRLLRPVIPALFGVLLFAATAQADPGEGTAEGPPATVEPAPGPTGSETSETSSGGSEVSVPAESTPVETTTPAESTTPVESGTPAESTTPAETGPPAESGTPTETGPAPSEPPPPPPAETPAAETPPPPETKPPAEVTTPAESTPPAELSTPAEAPPPPSEIPTAEMTHGNGQEHEHTSESATMLPLIPASDSGGGDAGGGEPQAVSAGGPLPPTGSEIVQLGGQAGAGPEAAAPLSRERAQIEQRAQQTRCELSVLGGPGAAGCSGGWMSEAPAIGSAPVSVASVAAVLGATNLGSDDGGDPGGTAGGGRPVAPEPGPAPSGAGGGVAAGGSGAGVGLSGFLTLAGLLLLAAPRALRRLRLFCRPFLTAFFVLIPERPG